MLSSYERANQLQRETPVVMGPNRETENDTFGFEEWHWAASTERTRYPPLNSSTEDGGAQLAESYRHSGIVVHGRASSSV